MWIKVRKDQKYLFMMMDSKTRFLISHEVADTKDKHDAKSLLRAGREIAGKRPLVFVTDGLPAYQDAYRKEFRMNALPRTEHLREIHIKGQKNCNNIQERLNGEFRDREKALHGLKKDDSPTLLGMVQYHNYAREHMALDGDTLADRAGIKIGGDNKIRIVIENAALEKRRAVAQAD